MNNLKQVVLSGDSAIIGTTDNRYFKVPSKYYTELALYIKNPSTAPLNSSLHHALSEAGTLLHADDRMNKSSIGKRVDTLMTKMIRVFACRFSSLINPLYIFQ